MKSSSAKVASSVPGTTGYQTRPRLRKSESNVNSFQSRMARVTDSDESAAFGTTGLTGKNVAVELTRQNTKSKNRY